MIPPLILEQVLSADTDLSDDLYSRAGLERFRVQAWD
jgi:hypothetical protein